MSTPNTPEGLARKRATHGEFAAYLHALVGLRRAEPRDDLVSALIAASEEEDRLDNREAPAPGRRAGVHRLRGLALAASADTLPWTSGLLVHGVLSLPVRVQVRF